jgi:hypothetical protein
MEIVALHLRDEANARTIRPEQDQFARSSFNRFYYAAFLRVRDGLAGMASGWDEMAHAGMPDLLRGKIAAAIKKELAQAKRNKDDELASTCSFALKAISELAKMLDQGRMTRVAADYRPEELIDFSKAPDFTLNAVSVSVAKSWPARADAHMRTIEKAWRQISV